MVRVVEVAGLELSRQHVVVSKLEDAEEVRKFLRTSAGVGMLSGLTSGAVIVAG